jgi:glycosyltransferase involved in cell wall biosynthesis
MRGTGTHTGKPRVAHVTTVDVVHTHTPKAGLLAQLAARNDMPELYALMDALVLPSYREGFPRAQKGATGRRIAEDRFDEQKVFDRVLSEYERLLQ